jgi:hypothetical protein
VAVGGPADGLSAIATPRTYARREARVNAGPRRVQVLQRSLVQAAAVLAAMEHVLHECRDAGCVGAAGALELAGASRHCL